MAFLWLSKNFVAYGDNDVQVHVEDLKYQLLIEPKLITIMLAYEIRNLKIIFS